MSVVSSLGAVGFISSKTKTLAQLQDFCAALRRGHNRSSLGEDVTRSISGPRSSGRDAVALQHDPTEVGKAAEEWLGALGGSELLALDSSSTAGEQLVI